MYPSNSKCNVKRCRCRKHLWTASTISSSVDSRLFSVVNYSDLDWKSTDLIYVISWRAVTCGMQYVGQTIHMLKTHFNKHYRRMNKPKKKIISCTVTKWHFYTTSGKN